MSFPVVRACLLLSLAMSLSAPAPAVLAQGAEGELAANLIRLRGDVEQLNDELELQRQEQRTALAGLSARQAELVAAVDRQQLVARELRDKLAAQREAIAQTGASGAQLLPLLNAALDGLEAYVRDGIPFKREERLGELAQARTQLQTGSLRPERAANRIWALYEDEFRLTRDNSLHSQTIVLGDERVLADVAKIGTVALYFRTADGRAGTGEPARETIKRGPEADKRSEPFTVMKYDIEVSGFGSQALGHVCLLNLKEQIFPGATLSKKWPTWTLPVLRWTKQQGGVGGYAHSGSGLQIDPVASTRTRPLAVAPSTIPSITPNCTTAATDDEYRYARSSGVSGNSGRSGRSIRREISVSFSVARPSRLKKPPGMRPPA